MYQELEDQLARFERIIIRRYGISWSEMQDIPIRTMWYWLQLDKEEEQEMEFQRMVARHGRRN